MRPAGTSKRKVLSAGSHCTGASSSSPLYSTPRAAASGPNAPVTVITSAPGAMTSRVTILRVNSITVTCDEPEAALPHPACVQSGDKASRLCSSLAIQPFSTRVTSGPAPMISPTRTSVPPSER